MHKTLDLLKQANSGELTEDRFAFKQLVDLAVEFERFRLVYKNDIVARSKEKYPVTKIGKLPVGKANKQLKDSK